MVDLLAYKSKANFKNVTSGVKKENLLLTHYSHALSALKKDLLEFLAHISITISWKMKEENYQKMWPQGFLLFESLC